MILNVSLDIYSWYIFAYPHKGSFPCIQSFIVLVCDLVTNAFVQVELNIDAMTCNGVVNILRKCLSLLKSDL